MAIWSTIFRDQMPKAVADQFDYLYASLQSFFGVSFNQDGTLIQPAPGANLVPLGSILSYAGSSSTVPSGWLLCDGRAVDRVAYKQLFELIGATYGAGDGSTTFNLPDLRQRFPLGQAASGTGSTLGASGGAIDHTHTGPSHTHSVSGSTGATDIDHTHTVSGITSGHTHAFTTGQAINDTTVNVANGADSIVESKFHEHGGTTNSATDSFSVDSGGMSTNNPHTHGAGSLTADTAGTGATGSANPPFLAVSYIVLALV